jgi:ferritin-like metal-binding protein YciE
LLLPHNHFIFAELDSGGDEQNLKLVFTTHEISVRGHHLRRIETVMQRLELSLLAKLPGSQRKLITEGQPVVLEIKVTEAKDAEKEAK